MVRVTKEEDPIYITSPAASWCALNGNTLIINKREVGFIQVIIYLLLFIAHNQYF